MTARRLPPLVLVAALADALAAASPVVAGAQPACAPGTLAESLGVAAGCHVDGVTFSHFAGAFARAGFHGGTAPPLAGSTVTGAADGGPAFDFAFDVGGVGPGGTIGLSSIAPFTAMVDATAAASVRLGAGARISVWSEPGGATVLAETTHYGAAPATYRCVAAGSSVPCGPQVSTAFAGGRAHARAEVAVQAVASIPVSASLTSLNVLIGVPAAAPPPATAVMPEPAPGPLLAAGLAALGVGSRRRRTLPKL